MSTIFAKIISGDLPAKKIYETERILVIEDIDPQAPVHLLLISKKGYLSLHDIPKQELTILQEMGEVAQMLAEKFGIAKNYRFLTNIGKEGGQTIFHLHFHLLGGKQLGTIG